MKILINTSSFPNEMNNISGIFILDQINNLVKFYNELSFVVCTPGPTTKNILKNKNIKIYNFRYFFSKKYEKIGIKSFTDLISESKFNYIIIFFFVVSQLTKMISITLKEKPDLLYSHWFTPQALVSYFISKIFKLPHKITIHSRDIQIFTMYFGKLGSIIARKILNSSSGISVTSTNILKTVDDVLEKNDKELLNILNFPMGIDSLKLDLINEDKEILDYIDLEKKYILFIGRLVDNKGLELLINAFEQFSKVSEYSLIIAGFGHLESKLKQQVKKFGIESRVIFTGEVNSSQKKSLLQNSEILIIPSDIVPGGLVSEGMPVTILEGLHFGKIVVASVYTNCEDVISSHVNGFIYKSNNPTDLKDNLVKITNLDPKILKEIKFNASNSSKVYGSKGSAEKYYDFLIQ